LIISALRNSFEVAEELLKHGANVNAQDKDFNTALHIASS
jgi:ankyrin repeat protein